MTTRRAHTNESTRLTRNCFSNKQFFLTDCHRSILALSMFATILQDLRFALRQFRRNIGFSLPAVLTLALGVGSATAIFSIVNGILLARLQFPHADQLMAV